MSKIMNITHIDVDYESGSLPFFKVIAEDGKKYQIKLPNVHRTTMLKEYIANQVADRIGDLTPNGVFLRILNVEQQLVPIIEQIMEYAQSSNKAIETSLDMFENVDKEIILFGIEWLGQNELKFTDMEELYFIFDECIMENIYAIFSFDQLLVNKDRHKGNILPCTIGSDIVLYLIDHDGIFGLSDGLETFKDLKDVFACLRTNQNQYLFDYIKTEEQKIKIMNVAKKIQLLQKDDMIKMLESFLYICPSDILKYNGVIEEIASFIAHRANNIQQACEEVMKMESCYA